MLHVMLHPRVGIQSHMELPQKKAMLGVPLPRALKEKENSEGGNSLLHATFQRSAP